MRRGRVGLKENWISLGLGFFLKTLTLELGGEREWQHGVVVEADIVAAPDWSESGGVEGLNYALDIGNKKNPKFLDR